MNTHTILSQYWGHSSFRPMQEDIVNAVLEHKDVLALLPTGGGKSVCFQVPAMLMDGLCLVISPLIALMKDQEQNLLKKNIPAATIHSGLTPFEVQNILQHAVDGEYKFLYVSPERLETNIFKDYLPSINICLIAVDEAHCISQWGYDFRPPYLRIASLRNQLPHTPVIALTASATPIVQQDIIEKLNLSNNAIFKQSFEKPNLSFSIFNVESKINKIIEIINNVHGSTIIYCNSRRKTKEVTELLLLQNISADFYHAGLSHQERSTKQESWINNITRIMVCTNAFGMGIDKPDVRTVIHYDAPECLENYYQEAGRAGRDGKMSFAVLLYQQQDISNLLSLPDTKYPSVKDIKIVYGAIANYLKIPVGIGKDNYYNFDLNDFTVKFKLDPRLVINTIKMLEQEGHISFSENIFLPSQAVFTTSRELLQAVKISYPHLDTVCKCLLRTYEGIFDNRVSIHEKQIARLCRLTPEEVARRLQQLHHYGVIDYWALKNTPQLHFELNRAPAQDLYIDNEAYLERRLNYKARIDKMIEYVQLQNNCRSQFVASYFGDNEVKECGICDNCLRKKNHTLSIKEFEDIGEQIIELLSVNPIHINDLPKHIKACGKQALQYVIDFLIKERKIILDESGMIRC